MTATHDRGLTLLELLLILVVLAIIVTIAIPNLLSSRASANESGAIASLRMLVQSQTIFAGRGVADQNANGSGEFGTFAELAGTVAVRAADGGTAFLNPPVLARSFADINAAGELARSGYVFRLYLPDAAGDGLDELGGGGADANVDPDRAEQSWCAYAWPISYGNSGRLTFFVNQAGDMLFTENQVYEGSGAPITAGAAYAQPGDAANLLGTIAVNEVGRDGNTWRTVSR